MEKDFLYLSRELLQKLTFIVDWMNDNPDVVEVNIYELTERLIEFGYVEKLFNSISEFNDFDVCNDINNKLIKLINTMLEKRKESIINFTNSTGIVDTFNKFVTDMFNGNCGHDNDYKKLICKELGVLYYIYKKRKKEPNFIYDNTLEFEILKEASESYGDDLSREIICKIEGYYKANDKVVRKAVPSYDKKNCYDQISFSSQDEERKFIDEKTNNFSIDVSLLDRENNNGIIVITKDSFYAVEPVDIHQMAFQKLFRCINDSDVFLDITEVEDYYVYEGNILIRVVNRGGVIGFDPYIPQEINLYQKIKLERLIHSLDKVYRELQKFDKKNAVNIEYGLMEMSNMSK